MNLNELYRLICNLARIGTVLEVDTEKYLARVETGENKTDWIRWAVSRAGEAVTWWAPTVGEQVYILCPCGEMETAFIAGSLYSEVAPPPDAGATTCVILHPDGARISYDPEASALVVSGVKTASVTASESITATVPVVTVKADTRVTLDTPEVVCTNKLTVQSAEIVPYQIDATLYIYPGPEAEPVRQASEQQLQAYIAAQNRLGRDIRLSAIYAALHVEGVQRVELAQPVADIVLSDYQASHCTEYTITVGGYDE